MSRHPPPAALAACLLAACLLAVGPLAGCAGLHPAAPVERLDERTGLTVRSLPAPIELAPRSVPTTGRRPSYAYLGPVDWNRMGTHTQALWVHLAPVQGQAIADIRAPGVLTLLLDDGELGLRVIAAPVLAREPYQPAAPWGQTAYFGVTAHDLGRLAASARLVLRCQADDGAPLSFEATADARAVLGRYLQAGDVTGD